MISKTQSLTDRQVDCNYPFSNNNEHNAIDIIKFVCAILVVSIHVTPFGTSDNYIVCLLNYGITNWLSRIAVPFFFVASGFFLYKKTSLKNFSFIRTKFYTLKLLRLYVIWTLIYSPFRIKNILADPKGIIHGILAYGRDIVFTGSYIQLWYFPALIFSVVLISFLLSKKISLKKILFVAALLYAVGLLAQSWFGIIEPLRVNAPELWSFLKITQKIIGTTRDGLFEGFLFVGMGAYFAFNGFRLQQKKAFFGIVISYILMLVEAVCVKYFAFLRACDMYICLVPLTYYVFGFVLNWRIPRKSNIFVVLRALSSLIFFTHLWVKWFVSKLFNIMGYQIEKTSLLFISTVIFSIAFSFLIYKLSQCSRLKWLRKLYS